MNIINRITQHVKPDQVPVLIIDQPLYAIALLYTNNINILHNILKYKHI